MFKKKNGFVARLRAIIMNVDLQKINLRINQIIYIKNSVKDWLFRTGRRFYSSLRNVLSGKYLGISVALDDPTSCANYIDGAKNIRLQDDIVVFFGIIRKKDKPYSDNMKFIFNKILQTYNLTMDELTADL